MNIYHAMQWHPGKAIQELIMEKTSFILYSNALAEFRSPCLFKNTVNYLGKKFFFCEITFWNYWTRHPRSTLILRSICILLKRVNKMPLIFLAWQDDTGQAVKNLCSLHGAEWQDNYDYSEKFGLSSAFVQHQRCSWWEEGRTQRDVHTEIVILRYSQALFAPQLQDGGFQA